MSFFVRIFDRGRFYSDLPGSFVEYNEADTRGDNWVTASNNRDYGDPDFKNGYSYRVMGAGLAAGSKKGHALARRYGRAARRKKALTVFEKHSLKIARQTWNMPDAMLGVMGGMSKAQAREVIRQLTGKDPI